MAGDVMCEAPRRPVAKMRVHDYLYDSSFIVSGARDYARMAFKAAMASAQLSIQPVYETMFSESRQYPSMQVVYHPNCRLPAHVDRSYTAYRLRARESRAAPAQPAVRTYKYTAIEMSLQAEEGAAGEERVAGLPPALPARPHDHKPVSRGTQSVYRESSAQTRPWQPDSKVAAGCGTPEVLYLDHMEWGPGNPYRTGDLPADFHTTEIINKMRHARQWSKLVDGAGQLPAGLKKRTAVLADLETKDYMFREAEIDELQQIRLGILHKMQAQQRETQTSRTGRRLAEMWTRKKREMETRIDGIRRNRDRELRKLSLSHGTGASRLEAQREARGARSGSRAAADRAGSVHAPPARAGLHARHRHARLTYDLQLLELEDHENLLPTPARDVKRARCGRRDPGLPCERETRWSEHFLAALHDDLKKARLGAALVSPRPLRILQPRAVPTPPRAASPEVEGIPDEEEQSHQSALVLQKIIRGRAVQNLMVEGRTRAAELMRELKTTHGLQHEDRQRISEEEARARDHRVTRTAAEQKEEAVSALVSEVCGGAAAAALAFLDKELRRLREERRQHAYILIALREKTLREAAEAGRRQKEEHRRREHDEIFRQVVGATQVTVDLYLRDVVRQGVELAAEQDAVSRARAAADEVERTIEEHASMSSAQQCEAVSELVHQFLLPESQRAASRLRLAALQAARMDAVRREMFDVDEDGDEEPCTTCGHVAGACRCRACDVTGPARVPAARDDPRWKMARRRSVPERGYDERFPPALEMGGLAHDLVDDAVRLSRVRGEERCRAGALVGRLLREALEVRLDAAALLRHAVSVATGEVRAPVRTPRYHFLTRRAHYDAAERERPHRPDTGPLELPSEVRRRQLEEAERARSADDACRCDDAEAVHEIDTLTEEQRRGLLPSQLRRLEDMRRCKCDAAPTPPATPSPSHTGAETSGQPSASSGSGSPRAPVTSAASTTTVTPQESPGPHTPDQTSADQPRPDIGEDDKD